MLAMRAILASGDVLCAAHALFEAAWGRGQEVSERSVLVEAMGQAGFAELERIKAVDYVEGLKFHVGDRSFSDGVEIDANHLLASGSHKLQIRRSGA